MGGHGSFRAPKCITAYGFYVIPSQKPGAAAIQSAHADQLAVRALFTEGKAFGIPTRTASAKGHLCLLVVERISLHAVSVDRRFPDRHGLDLVELDAS